MGDEVTDVRFSRPQVAALLILLEQADLTSYPAALRSELLGARNQLEVWQRAAGPGDARELHGGEA